ncbi:hypothetical protein T265_07715 [Opisthorchis viverrini]|uniref:DUF4817 domain-containing protein n=1 Tax=Opisthorchis viverrini TaxID=6198 RepID=A0A074ZGA4_OPIVI|nr:hypothetical protein T265_07715 [Opisthorchis viverrini]KER24667.1 hypothetical protein T265_07715 [Opisthorchis viverrini]
MSPEGSMRAGILTGCPSLDRGSREAEVGFEPRTFRQLNVLHQAASCVSCYDIRNIAIHVYSYCTTHEVAENSSTAHDDRFRPSWGSPAVASFRCLTVTPPEESTRAGILPGCPSLDRGSREVEVRSEQRTFRIPLGESATTALHGYKTKHGLIKDPFTVSTITRLIAKFESTGSVLDFPGIGRKSLSDERAPIVQNAVEQLQSQSTMASSSIAEASQLTGIPRAKVHRIMRRHHHLHPYHFTLLQNITEEDKEHHVTFANWLLDNEEIVPNILWSDEANFSVDDIINKHNCAI